MLNIVVPVVRRPGETRPGTPQGAVPDVISRIVQPTAGKVMPIEIGESISGTFRTLLEGFRTSYVLQFTPTGVPSDGWHNVSVKVTRPGNYSVRARSGYGTRRPR
jgi:hypothetical protein